MTRTLNILMIVALTAFVGLAGCKSNQQEEQASPTGAPGTQEEQIPIANAPDTPEEPTPPADPNDVPGLVLSEMTALLQPPQARNQQDFEERFAPMQHALLAKADAALADYPQAGNKMLVLSMMFRAANFLDYYDQTDESRERLIAVTDDIMVSDAPADFKLTADAIRTGSVIADAADKPQLLRDLVARYADTDQAGQALLAAAMIADVEELIDLRDQLADKLEADHLPESDVSPFLESLGRTVPFAAILTRLDGTTLTLPNDLLGKVVVVEFWATWCPPCVQAMPHMKKLYQENRDKGLEVVGISFDDPGNLQKVQDFVTAGGYDWIHTFSNQGRFTADPTGRKYNIQSTPSVWVLDRNGMVITKNAIDATASTLSKAMQGVDRVVAEALAHPVDGPAE